MENSRSRVKRAPKRGIYEREKIYEILDREFLCHVAFVQHGQPVVIPTMFGREGDRLYIHGASVSRLLNEVEKGMDICLSVANVNDLVLARSAFHHSLNYESVVVFGKGRMLEDDKKLHALKVISDHLIPGRWEEVREPNPTELKATKVIEIEITECSAKARSGPPIDDKEDYELDIWAGLLPIEKQFGQAVNDPALKGGVQVPGSVLSKSSSK